LDLFSGIGGIGIGLKPFGVRTVTYCEKDRYAQGVLLSRMQSNDIDRAPIWDDVTTLHADMLPRIDIIFGGFPCQDISVAGAGAGLEGKRSGLFYEIIRLTKETGSPFVFLENVPAIRTRGLLQVLKEFTEMGYDCRWTCLSAASVGANHKRERWFLLAYSNSAWKLSEQETRQQSANRTSNSGKVIRNTSSKGFQNRSVEQMEQSKSITQFERPDWWAIEPDVGRVANGIPRRVDRIKCLGNSVVPKQITVAFSKLIGMNLDSKSEDQLSFNV